jgi:deoxyribose-phosphate aldolase
MCDHTLLKPEATAADVAALIAQGRELGVCAVCVSPSQLPLQAPGLRVAVVCGFPSGAHTSLVKAAVAARAVADGADEVDMVVNLGAAKAGDWALVESDIAAVRAAASETVLKVILETGALSDDEIVRACQAAEAAGADFVKTSTGFHPTGGATVHAVELMKATVGDRLQVKASGGIRTRADAEAMIAAGATRLGVSATAAILAEY